MFFFLKKKILKKINFFYIYCLVWAAASDGKILILDISTLAIKSSFE